MSARQDIDDVPEWGPKMKALPNDRQRAFVVALFDEEAPIKGDGLFIYAAEKAGYQGSSNKSLGVMAARLVRDERMQAAIAEYSRTTVRAISPEAIRALKEVIRNPKHRDHMRAIAAVADRVDPPETTTTLKIEDHRPASPEITQRVLDRIEDLMRRAGLVSKPAPMIEGSFQVVEDGGA